MDITLISDTHNKHNLLNSQLQEGGDLIIHAGDCTSIGSDSEVLDFLEWFSNLDYAHNVMVAGNHDFGFEDNAGYFEDLCRKYGVVYLNDSGYEVDGIRIWGSPMSLTFGDWAFMDDSLYKNWDKIPDNIDILITHGPAYGVLDMVSRGEHTGCPDLRKKIDEIKPKIHVCGHIHEGRGIEHRDGVIHVNASSLDEYYQLQRDGGVFHLEEF